MPHYKILILGASYGSLVGTKLLLAGHDVKLACLPEEADLISNEGTRVRMPVRGRSEMVEIDSRTLPGELSADAPSDVDPSEFDLVTLAMQEPSYGLPGVRELVEAVAQADVPMMSIMNMPPLPYLTRIGGVDADASRHCYTDPSVWDCFDPALLTLCSPDPQAFRPSAEEPNVLQVRLPTNFKAARFDSDAHTAILRDLEADIDASRFPTEDGDIELPVKLRVHDSVFVPLAKWSMLLAGNYRCVQRDGIRTISEAVHSDLDATRGVYEWVAEVCIRLGASTENLVPFEKYAKAAESLNSPSSVARTLFAGARQIERVELLVQSLAAQKDMHSEEVDQIVALVEARLEENSAGVEREGVGQAS